MTVFEHAMLGTSLALAAGLQHRFGWRIALLAGVAGTVSDWDGLSILWGAEADANWHGGVADSVRGAAALGAVWGALDHCYGFTAWVVSRAASADSTPAAPGGFGRLCLWMGIGALAEISHIPADVIYSG